jgi:hypothetical protein
MGASYTEEVVRRGVLLVCAVLVVAVPASAGLQPQLRLVDSSPLTLAGAGFKKSERVTLALYVHDARYAKRVRATLGGTFRVAFQSAGAIDRCNTDVWAQATGSRGSSATMKRAQPQCPPALSPPG